MNQRLLYAYWSILLVLLLGDALAGLAWLFRYRNLVAGLREGLMDEFQVYILSKCYIKKGRETTAKAIEFPCYDLGRYYDEITKG